MLTACRVFGLAITLAMLFSQLLGTADAGSVSLYVANEGNGTVRQFSQSGTDLGNFVSGLTAPTTLTVNQSGDLFVSNYGGSSVREYSPQGTLLLTISTSFQPGQVQIAANGDLLVNNYFGGDVAQYSATGQYLGIFSNPGLARAYFSALDSQGNLYVTDFMTGVVRKISSTGVDEGNFISNVAGVTGIAFDPKGDLYVVINGGQYKILEYSPTGTFLGLITDTGLSSPYGLTFGPDGNIYVANAGNDSVTYYTPSGTYLGVFADTGLSAPNGVAFSASVPEPSSAVLLILAGVATAIGVSVRKRSGISSTSSFACPSS